MSADLLQLYQALGHVPRSVPVTSTPGLHGLDVLVAASSAPPTTVPLAAFTSAAPDPAELPPLDPEQARLLEQLLDEDPERVLAFAQEVWDQNITLPVLRSTLSRARAALERPELAATELRAIEMFRAASDRLPPDFTFDGIDLTAIPIQPADRKFEAAEDSLGWAIMSGPQLLGGLLGLGRRAPFRPHTSSGTGFIYQLDAPTQGSPLEVALFSDFGTGRYHALYIAKQFRTRAFPYVIHLGDTYYSGRRSEFHEHIRDPLAPIQSSARIYLMNANHEMLSGAIPYFEYLDELRGIAGARHQQEGSYFCLRSDAFQIVGIDTAYHRNGRLRSKPGDEAEQRNWLEQMLREGKTAGSVNILLSPNEPYAYGSEDPKALYERDLAPLAREGLIDLWFWGNTHYGALFERTDRYPFFGSCIGHAGYPFVRQRTGRSSPATLLFLETAGRFPERYSKLRTDVGRDRRRPLQLLTLFAAWLGRGQTIRQGLWSIAVPRGQAM